LVRAETQAGRVPGKWILVLLVSLVPVSRVFQLGGGKQANLAAADPVLAVGIVLLIGMILRGKAELPRLPLFAAVALLMVFSAIYNLDRSLVAKGPVGVTVEIVKALVLWLYLYLVVNLLGGRRDHLVIALRTWIIAGVGVALFGIYGAMAYMLWRKVTPFSEMFRAQGTLNDANLYATHLIVTTMLGLLYWGLTGRRQHWVFAAIAIIVTGVIFSGSRGGLLSLTLVSTVYWLLVCSPKIKIVSIGVLGAAVLILLWSADMERLLAGNPLTARLATATVNVNDEHASDRKQLWLRALEEFEESPLIGVGRGNFGYRHVAEGRNQEFAHNTYLALACDIGVVGLALYLFLAASFAIPLGSLAFHPEGRYLAGPLLCALAAVALNGITVNIENYRGLWCLMGIMHVSYRAAMRAEAEASREWLANSSSTAMVRA
jgi:O-antigen ligase